MGRLRQAEETSAPLAEINMVPLIDVMLVLLVIFIVTAPLLTHAVQVELPRVSSRSTTPPETEGHLDIAADGSLAWNGRATDADALARALADLARSAPVAELRIHADRHTPYEILARTLALAARQGVNRIGFVSLPNP